MNHKTHSFCTLIWQYSWYMWFPKGQLSTCMLQQKPPFLSVLFLVSQRLWINNRSTDGICSMSARRTWAQFCPYRPIMLSYSALFMWLFNARGIVVFIRIVFLLLCSIRFLRAQRDRYILQSRIKAVFKEGSIIQGPCGKWIHETLGESIVHLIHSDGSRSSC